MLTLRSLLFTTWVFANAACGWRKYPGKIHFCIGPAIDPAGRTPKEINELAQEWIENKMLEISSHYTK
jgi:hypothetical protein